MNEPLDARFCMKPDERQKQISKFFATSPQSYSTFKAIAFDGRVPNIAIELNAVLVSE